MADHNSGSRRGQKACQLIDKEAEEVGREHDQ